ncbi:unnamed protein product [Phaedon cochleariae]|uniref:Uncharacterized protein n=1 Tax=Phaedon cochleariae TaxID=80249 RepID=A0A9N9SGB1_PHACE|nr:unnamed protein product [Phaedon cochleariae]
METSSYSETSCENVNAVDLASSLAFRPRGSLARALYRKEKHDEYLSQFDKAETSGQTENVGLLKFIELEQFMNE